MEYLPVNIRIKERQILIVGGGNVATHKAQILHRFTNRVTVIAPEISAGIKALPFQWKEKPIEPQDLDSIDVLFVCTDDHTLNREIKEWADERHLLTSVCDNPPLCEFTSPAIWKEDRDEGALTIAVASDAKDVKRSIRVRNRIQSLIDSGLLSLE